MEKLFRLFIHRRLLIATCFVLVAAIGVYSWFQLPIDAYPDIADVTVQVATQVPGLASEEIEQQITIPLERELNGMPGLQTMRSKNMFGISTIILVFKDGVDDYWARQRVQERINGVDLPFGAQPSLNPLTSPTGEVCRYIIESKSHSLREITDLQKWVIIPRIKQVTGVADVSNFGGITTQFQVEIDPRKLEKYDIPLSTVIERIEKNNANAGGSMIGLGDLTYVVRGIGLIKDLNDLGKIVVKTANGLPIYLNDLGTIKYGNLERKGVMGFTDRTRDYSDGVEGIVQLLRYENPSVVLENVHKAIDELNKEILPKRCSDSRIYGPDTACECHPWNRFAHLAVWGISGLCRIDCLPGKLAGCFGYRRGNPAIAAYRVYPDAPDQYSGEPFVAWCYRLWNYRRRGNCHVGNGVAEKGRKSFRTVSCRQYCKTVCRNGKAHFLFDADYHHGLSSAFHLRTD